MPLAVAGANAAPRIVVAAPAAATASTLDANHAVHASPLHNERLSSLPARTRLPRHRSPPPSEAAPAAGDGASPQRDARAAAEPHARVYLHADEDGERVSLRPHRASLNTAWRVHRVRQAGDDYVLLQSAAYGRYLATSPHQVSLAYAGHAAIQVAYDAPEQDDVVWEAVRVADDTDDVLMLRVSNRVLRAPPPGTQSCRLVVDTSLTSVSLQQFPRGDGLRRTILYMRANNEGVFDPMTKKTSEFSGRSLFNLKGDLASQLREAFDNITLCVRPGSQGRLTPLVIDLPANEDIMEIVVLTTGSPGESFAVYFSNSGQQFLYLCLQ
nr:unnamed protein product [Digitaria exilis]